MSNNPDRDLVDVGIAAADVPIQRQVAIWARHTNEKADVAADMMGALRWLHRALPPDHAIRTLSIGSSDEPQFPILQPASAAGLWLFDADQDALDAVRRKGERQTLGNVHVAQGDYTTSFATPAAARQTLQEHLGGERFNLVLLHHSLYYCQASQWPAIISALQSEVLATPGAMHLALMSATTPRPYTTTWLYNQFAEEFFNHHNDQALPALQQTLAAERGQTGIEYRSHEGDVFFKCDDFFKFMAVVWMIMLHPHGHYYSEDQRREVTEFVLKHFWAERRPLIQIQDYLTILKPPTP